MAAGLAALALAAGGPGPARGAAFMAGAATVDLDPPAGTPLAGYGGLARRTWLPGLLGGDGPAFWFRPATGTRDPLRVRALVLETGEARLVWIALDVVGVDPRLGAELQERLEGGGQRGATVIVSASHTHSGPGGYADSELFGLIALDRPSREVRRHLLDRMEEAARRAARGLTPAQVGAASVRVRGWNPSRIHETADDELAAVKLVDASGRPLALLWNFALHGTALGQNNLALSGDVMGDASARLERSLGVPALFINGAVADASPPQRGAAGVAAVGAALADGGLAAWRAAVPAPRPGLSIARRRLSLPFPRLSVRSCLGAWVPPGIRIGLDGALPDTTELVAVGLGERVAAVTIPGELQMALGLEIKAAAHAHFATVLVAGVSNDYLGYLLTPGQASRPSYMACGSFYGAAAGDLVRRAASGLLEDLRAAHLASAARLPGRPRSEGAPGTTERGRVANLSRGSVSEAQRRQLGVPLRAGALPAQSALRGEVRKGGRAPLRAKPSPRASAPAPTSSAPRCCGG